MPRQSAGLLMYRRAPALEVFLVHPGGPYFARRDEGVWTVPKGEPDAGEDLLATACREFAEETGWDVEACRRGELVALGSVSQKGGKVVYAWAFEGEPPPGAPLVSGTFRVVWPPKSGAWRTFPEVDRGEFFDLAAARVRINAAQTAFLDRLAERVAG